MFRSIPFKADNYSKYNLQPPPPPNKKVAKLTITIYL